jgi:ATP-dependent Clp protease ATP-binding subunit ClpA
VGYEQEGQLTGRLRRRPYSVVLLDEIEKAHPDVQHLFLQLFDAGRLTDARGNLADGRNAIFIMTTNLGAKEALGFIGQQKPYRNRLHEAIVAHFTPEFLNRIDRIAYFNPLTPALLLEIFDKLFAPVAARFRAQGIEVEVAEPFKRKLCAQYADEKRGARPLTRGIEDEIVAPLTDKLLAGELKPGMKVRLGEESEFEMHDAPNLDPVGFDQKQPASPQDPAPPPDPDVSPGMDLRMDPEEVRNRQIVAPLLAALQARLAEQDVDVVMKESAWEKLCSPYMADAAVKANVAAGFSRLVEEPLLQKVEAGEFQAGDRIEIYKNSDLNIDFRKAEGETA